MSDTLNAATITVTVRYGLGNEVRRNLSTPTTVGAVLTQAVLDVLGVPADYTVTASGAAVTANTPITGDCTLELAAKACSKA